MTIYQEYAKAKQAIKALTSKVKELEPQILEEIKDLSEPMRTDSGTFTTADRFSYKYSLELTTKEKEYKDEIKILQAKELECGKVEVSKATGVRFIEKN